MGIYLACQCGQAFSADAHLAGQTLRCPSCGRPLSVPQPRLHAAAAPVPTYAPTVATQFASSSPKTRGSLPLLLLGAAIALAATVAALGLAVWLLWAPLGSRDMADHPAAETHRGDPRSLAGQGRPNRPSRAARLELPERADRSAPSTAAGSTPGQTYRSSNGAVEFWMPAGAESETRKSFGTSAGLADRTRVTWGNRSTGQLMGTFYVYRGRHEDLAEDTRMKVGVSQGLYQAYGSRVVQRYTDITHGEFTGTEADIQVPGQRDNTMRFLYTGNYLVTLEATGPPGFAKSAPAVKFFNSLRLVAGE